MADISSEVRSIEREQSPQWGVATIEIAVSAKIEVADRRFFLAAAGTRSLHYACGFGRDDNGGAAI